MHLNILYIGFAYQQSLVSNSSNIVAVGHTLTQEQGRFVNDQNQKIMLIYFLSPNLTFESITLEVYVFIYTRKVYVTT